MLIRELRGGSLARRGLMVVGWMAGRVGLGIWLLLRRWGGLDVGGESVGEFGMQDVDIGRSSWSIR